MQQQNCLARGESTSGLDMKASDSIGTIGRSKMNEHELVPEGSCACVLCMCVCGDGGVLSCLFTSYTAVNCGNEFRHSVPVMAECAQLSEVKYIEGGIRARNRVYRAQ